VTRERIARVATVLAGAAAFAIPTAVYVASASHEPASWDTAELQGVPYILGISHPTGFPLFVLLGYVWSHVLAVGSVAFRMNAMSAVCLGVAALMAYAVALRIGASKPLALLATLWYAFTQNVWSHANRAEAQDLAVTCETVAIYAFVRWLQDEDPRWFAGAFALYGLGMAAHPNALWLLPAFAIGAITAKKRPSAGLVAVSLALTVAALGFYLYLPLRSAYIVAHGLDPTLALGTNGGIFWNYNNPSTPGGLLLDLTGSESNAPRAVLGSFNPVHVQAALWAFITGLGEQYGAFVAVLTFGGLFAAWKRDWRTALFLCLACTVGLLFSVTYSSEEGDIGRYRLLVLWLAVPFVASLVPRTLPGWKAAAARIVLVAFLAGGAIAAARAHPEYFRHDRGQGGRWVINVVAPLTSPGSVVMADWLDATSLAYGAYVDKSLPGRIIVSGWDAADMSQYKMWARARNVYILVNPHDVDEIDGAKRVANIDAYHALFEVNP
jgi:transmembrane protein TMEM260 (protein O-mannosyltransferase)